MIKEISIGRALELSHPLIDVRSPKEYQKGHVAGAENIPLFSDHERAKIGTTYKQKSKEEAINLGYQFATPKLHHFIDQALVLAPDEIVSVYCWRGGMRSKAFAKHLSENGFKKVNVINGGYKAYRNHILDKLSCPGQLKILGGYTGSGKTQILHVFKRRGEQVVDLEGLARHKGSAFGGLGEDEFPTTQQFENDLFHKWSTLDKNRPIWLEDEGHNIGPVRIPIDFYRAMRESYLYFIDIPKEARAKYLAEEYGKFKNYELKAAIRRISKRLGREREQQAIKYLLEEKYVEVALLALKYYDKFYFKGLKKRKKENVCTIRLRGVHHEQNAEKILKTIRDE